MARAVLNKPLALVRGVKIMKGSETKKYRLLICLVVCLSLCLFLASAGSAGAAEKVIRWRCQSPLPSTLDYFKQAAAALSEKVKQRSNGRFIIEVHGVGSIIPDQELFSGVKRGVLQMVFEGLTAE
jgi:TRAP-type mannitol/chloroaromatic compound transport system substrate-binding protein